MTKSHYGDKEDEASSNADNAISKTQSAKADAEQDAVRSENESETGAPLDESTNAVQNKMRGGLEKTEAALKLLGAGQPYQPGDY